MKKWNRTRIPAACLALAMTCLLLPSIGNAATVELSGTRGGTTSIQNGDIYIVKPLDRLDTPVLLFPLEQDKNATYISFVQGSQPLLYTESQPFLNAVEIPDFVKKYYSAMTVWGSVVLTSKLQSVSSATEFSIISAGALDEEGALKTDKDDMEWVVLDGNHSNILLQLPLNSVSPSVNLEHVVFRGGYGGTGNGGALSGSGGGGNRVGTIYGDVIFDDNYTHGNGGAVSVPTASTSFVFKGKVSFLNNKAGYQPDQELGLLERFSATDKRGGAIYMTSVVNLTFDDDAIFIGNMASGAGGAIYAFGGTDLAGGLGGKTRQDMIFNGKAIFINNRAGLGTNSSGGAIMFLQTGGPNALTFNDDAIFLGNEATNTGGAIHMQSYASVSFAKKATFADNRSGAAERILPAVNNTAASGTWAAANTNGGAIHLASNVTFSMAGESVFERNWARGSGGGVNLGAAEVANNGLGGSFGDSVTLSHNIAGMITEGSTYSSPSGGGLNSASALYFSNTVATLNAVGNLAFRRGFDATLNAGAGGFVVAGNGGAISSAGLYMDQRYNFTGNQAVYGGAININNLALPTINGVVKATLLELNNSGVFSNNIAFAFGGAIRATMHTGGMLIASGARFENNTAGDLGGAIYTSGTASIVSLQAKTGDIVFTGNKHQAGIITSGIDFDKILDQDDPNAGGYMTVSAGKSGIGNDITFATTATTSTTAGTLNMDAWSGHRIYLDGGITQSATDALTLNQITEDYAAKRALLTVEINKASGAAGQVVFNNASAIINGVTTVHGGTLSLLGGVTYGYDRTVAGTRFDLKSGATLEGSATVNAENITIETGATLRVVGGGVLSLNAGASVAYQTGIELAGNGLINTGVSTIAGVSAISLGDIGHTSAQNLVLENGAGSRVDLSLSGARISAGLFANGSSDKLIARSVNFNSAAGAIDLTSLKSGTFTLVETSAGISNLGTFNLSYKGTQLATGARLSYSVTTSANNLILTYQASNVTTKWNGASGDEWMTAGKWTNPSDTNFVVGDIVNFAADRSGSVTIGGNVAVSGITVAGNYTFTGQGGITANGAFWSAAADTGATGILTKTGANTLLTLANATGAGATNEFAGILIQGGTLAFGNAAQLGATLGKVTLAGTSAADAVTLAIVGKAILDGAAGNQRLDLAAGTVNSLKILGAANSLLMSNNTASSANGGVFNIGDAAVFTIVAEGGLALLGNKAAAGGAAYIGTNGVLNIDVAPVATVMFGEAGDTALRIDPNTSTTDSLASADDTASIIKTGAGILSLNADSSAYLGTLTINQGAVLMGRESILGGSVVVNNAGSLFGGVTIGGNVAIDNGAILQIGGEYSTIPQVMQIGGALSLDNATLRFDSFGADQERRVDSFVADSVDMDGINTFDFNFGNLTTGYYLVGSATGMHEETIAVSVTIFDDASGSLVPTATNTVLTTVLAGNVSNTGETKVTNLGNELTGGRVSARIEFEQSSTIVVSSSVIPSVTDPDTGEILTSGTTIILGTGTGYYNSGNIYVDVGILNYKMRWTGAQGAAWNSADENWLSSEIVDKKFLGGDGVLFDAIADAGNEINRDITIHAAGVSVGEVEVTGNGNYTFSGGKITGNASGKSSTLDGARGAFIMNGSGTVTFRNASNTFSGISMSDYGIQIYSGAVVGNAANLSNNNILNNSRLYFAQDTAGAFTGMIDGAGEVIKTGAGELSLTIGNTINAGRLEITAGAFRISAPNLVNVGVMEMHPGTELYLNSNIITGTFYNSGRIRPTNATQTTMTINGDYVSRTGSELVLYLQEISPLPSTVSNQAGIVSSNALVITGNASGALKLSLGHTTVSGTTVNLPAPRRDMRIITVGGSSSLQLENPVGEPFEFSGTGAAGNEYSHNLMLLRGRNGNIYLRNLDIAPANANLPVIGVSPAMSELLGRNNTTAVSQRIGARHDKIEKGMMAWMNYSRNDSRLRGDYLYAETRIQSDMLQAGFETALCTGKDAKSSSGLLAGFSYAFAKAEARSQDHSTVKVDSHIANLYASTRWKRLYADAIINYSPDATYKARVTAPLDSNGNVKGSRYGASMEIGYILNPRKGGQWEPYVQASYQSSSFGAISDPVNPENFEQDGRAYSFDDYKGCRALAGVRASAHLRLSANMILRPWGGFSAGKTFADKSEIALIDPKTTWRYDNTLSDDFYTFTGGVVARWGANLDIYLSSAWTGGDAYNAFNLTIGTNYRW